MNKIKKSNVAVSIMCVIAISVTSFMSGYAVNSANGLDYKSQGKIVFTNKTDDISDDVIFDASDFATIDKLVSDGKDSVKTKLNEYGTVNVTTEVPSFAELANAVQGISDGTNAEAKDIRKDKKALVGKNIVTGTLDITQNKTVTPNFSVGNVVVNYDLPFDAMQKVTINKDADLIADNIKKGIEIFGVTGNLNTDMQEKTITPNFASGNNVLTPDDNKAGMSKVTINTDADLKAENIKKDVEIFGVTGTLNSDLIDGGNEAVIASTTIYDYNGMYTDSGTIKRTIPQHSHGVCFKDIRVGLLVSFTVTVNDKLITNPEKAFEIPENAEVIVTFNVKNNKNETEVLREWIFASAWLVYWY